MSNASSSAAESDPTVHPLDPTVHPSDPTVHPSDPTVHPSDPTVHPLEEHDSLFKFRLANVNVSQANALRRVVMDDVPCYVFDIETCNIEINTGRLHNEILKHRLQCIPIHQKVHVSGWLAHQAEHDSLKDYVMELDVENNHTSNTIYITTGDFRVKNVKTGEYMSEPELNKLFPKSSVSNSHIIFARLRPSDQGGNVVAERLKLSCKFCIGTSADNSAFSAVCCSSYFNTIDEDRVIAAWDKLEAEMRSEEGIDQDEIEFRKKNFGLLDKYRHYIADSFDFKIETVGNYSGREVCRIACEILRHDFDHLAENIASDNATILHSETTMDNCFDFILEQGDYTIGKVLELHFYKRFLEKKITYCGFKKFHPHDTHSVLRVAYPSHIEDAQFKTELVEACKASAEYYKSLRGKF